MGQYKAVVVWERNGAVFTDNQYSRGHRWSFDGGIEVPASSSPLVVPGPRSVEAAVDPEEAFVASLSACHMLFYLSLAATRGFTIESYRDEAVGELRKNSSGRIAMTKVTLRPRVEYGGNARPSVEEDDAMHQESHELCYIASSVKTDVRCEPVRG